MKLLFIFFSFVCLLGVGSGRRLRWTHSTRYANGKNWSAGRTPCSTDTVVFPVSVDLEVVLPKGLQEMRELVLPSLGDLVLLYDTRLVFSSRDRIDGSCEGQENVWLRSEAGDWMDPKNWEGTNPATPDLERVPCPTDTVVISAMDMRISLPPFSVTVGHLNLTDVQEMDVPLILFSKRWSSLLSDDLFVSKEDCLNPNGCECPPQALQRWICPNVDCPEPTCLQPIKALGDCCLNCGAYLLFGFSPETSLSKVRGVVLSELSDSVSWYVSRTMGYIQVVLRQEDSNQDLEEMAKGLRSKLLHSGLGLQDRSLSLSGPYYSRSTTSSPVFLFFFTLFLALTGFGATLYYFERNRTIWPSWLRGSGRLTFARFENLSGLVEIGSTPRPSIQTKLSKEVTGFDNPMFAKVGRGLEAGESLLEDDSSEDSDSSYDRRTVTTLAVNEDSGLEEVPIGKLID